MRSPGNRPTRSLRRAAGHGLYHIQGVGCHVKLYSHAAEVAVEGLVQLACFLGCRVGRVGVECVEHCTDCLVDKRVGIHFVNIVVVDYPWAYCSFRSGVSSNFCCALMPDEARMEC